jgi:hypothetical protein
MTSPERARRLRLTVIRCTGKARRADLRAAAARTEQVREDWRALAADYRLTATEAVDFLHDLDAPTEAACEECGAAEGEDCDPGCDCDTCEINRALDEDADRYEEV